ncbi:MAG: pseudouridine synthase [Bacteroidales bacterium]|nr:pseudouridine synthase [Bacteroidales bacterium]
MSENNEWKAEDNPGGESRKNDENGDKHRAKRPVYSTREDSEKRHRRPRKIVDPSPAKETPREYKPQREDRPDRDYRPYSSDRPDTYNPYPPREPRYQPGENRDQGGGNRYQPRDNRGPVRDNRNSDQQNRYPSRDNRSTDSGNRYAPRTDRNDRGNRNDNTSDRYNRTDSGRPQGERPSYQRNDRSYGGGRPDQRDGRRPYDGQNRRSNDSRSGSGKPFQKNYRVQTTEEAPVLPTTYDGPVRLNKYIANAGICSRREADKLIIAGAVSVNGVIVITLGARVNPGDKVQYGEQTLTGERKLYVLLNKPKNYITTMDDPQDRKTVMALVRNACRERIFPVGRLDRSTTGLLLLTNDGDMAKKLTHPSSRIRKVYHVTLDKALSRTDMQQIAEGIELEDGLIQVDAVAYVGNGDDKKQIGLEIHSGKNRIVRRIFESLQYQVVKLDRVVFAGLTKKDVPRGQWRFLNIKEINYMKML